MSRKLVFGVSLFGLGMGVATVFWISSNVEPAFWLTLDRREMQIVSVVILQKISDFLPERHFYV